MAASADPWRPGSQGFRISPRPKHLPEVSRRTPPTPGVGPAVVWPHVTYVTGFDQRIEIGTPSTPDLRRLPKLGQPLQGCRSSPNLDWGRRSRPVSAVSDAATSAPTVSTFATAAAGAQKAGTEEQKWGARRSFLAQAVSAGPLKTLLSTQRWNAPIPTKDSRLHREEALERDRQRQRAACGWDNQRNLASPARSRGASLFFEGVPCADEVASALPEPFRHVARPRTRQYMPRAVVADPVPKEEPTGTSSGSGETPRKSSKQGPIEEFGNADLVFDQEEMIDLISTLDHFATLIRPPGREVDPLQTLQLAVGQTELVRDIAGRIDMSSMAVVRELERQGPLILRQMYCRFLLSSKLCGQGPSSIYKFHELVALFDEKSCLYGSFTGMSRHMLSCVLAKLLVPNADPKKGRDPTIPKDEKLKFFFKHALPALKEHSDGRRRRLDLLIRRTPPVKKKKVPQSILQEVTEENLWPPLPPRGCTAVELSGYMTGVRQWEEELGRQNATRLLALRAHTEAVVRGEMICSQLLEPEVLHFATRFRPLFKTLFTAYCDWPDPQPAPLPQVPMPKLSLLRECLTQSFSVQKQKEPEDPQAIGLGHMSFMAFFRFCVDFGLFPQHANFEEIVNIYNDSECVRRLPELETDITQPILEEPLWQDPVAPAEKLALEAAKGKRRAASATPSNSSRPMTSATKQSARPPSRKMQAAISKASAAAVSVSEENLPKADLRFFERPMSLMSQFEIRTVAFFAAIDEWLGEKFVRLADLVTKTCEDEEDVQKGKDAVYKAAFSAAMFAANLDENGEWIPDPDPTGKPAAPFRNKDEEKQAKNAAMRMAKSSTEIALASVVPTVHISAGGLLDVISPMKALYKPSEEDIEDMFRLLLAGPDENGQYGTVHEGMSDKPPTMPVFQLDKVLRKAQETMDKARRWSCALMRTEAERSPAETRCFAFFEAICDKMFESAKWLGGELQDIFADVNELTPDVLIAKARELNVSDELFPKTEDLANLLIEVVGRREASMDRHLAYRAMALMLEGRHREQQKALRGRLQCQTHASTESLRQAEGPKTVVFGLAAFMESLIKLALLRLGFKGWSDIQRGSPAWWKCTWLLTLVNGKFNEKISAMQFERKIFEMGMEQDGTWEEAFSDQLGVGIFNPNSYFSRHLSLMQKQPSDEASSVGSLESKNSRNSGARGGSRASGRSPPRRQASQAGTPMQGNTPREGQKNVRSNLSDDGASSVGGRSNRSNRSNMRRPGSRKSGTTKQKKEELLRIERGPNQDAEVWWRKVQTGWVMNHIPRNIPAMEWLALESPDLFDPERAEAPAPPPVVTPARSERPSVVKQPARTSVMSTMTMTSQYSTLSTASPVTGLDSSLRSAGDSALGKRESVSRHDPPEPCKLCGEKPSSGGWGNPSCVECSGVEIHCLPIQNHIFCELLNTVVPDELRDEATEEASGEKRALTRDSTYGEDIGWEAEGEAQFASDRQASD